MPTAIIGLLTTLLPFVLKLAMYLIDKKNDNDDLKRKFLLFLSDVEKDVSVKLHDRYKEQIERLKKEINEGK